MRTTTVFFLILAVTFVAVSPAQAQPASAPTGPCEWSVVRREWNCTLRQGEQVRLPGLIGKLLVIRRKAPTSAPAPAPVPTPVVAVPPQFKLDVGLSAGVLGASRYITGFGATSIGLEYRLTSWAGVLAMGQVGGGGGLLEGRVNSLWGAGLGVAFWPAPWARIVLAGGCEDTRNQSWNSSLVGPVGIARVDFLLGDSGFAIGLTASGGPGWDWDGNMWGRWSVSAGLRFFFGGPRR